MQYINNSVYAVGGHEGYCLCDCVKMIACVGVERCFGQTLLGKERGWLVGLGLTLPSSYTLKGAWGLHNNSHLVFGKHIPAHSKMLSYTLQTERDRVYQDM